MKRTINPDAMAEQRALVDSLRERGTLTTYAQIGRLWHSSRRCTYGVRFSDTADLVPRTFDDGSQWEPLEAVSLRKQAGF